MKYDCEGGQFRRSETTSNNFFLTIFTVKLQNVILNTFFVVFKTITENLGKQFIWKTIHINLLLR